MCRWIGHADRQPAPARTRALWPPRMSSSQLTWGRWWWKEQPQTLDSHRWRSRRWASPSPSSWTVSSERGRLHRAIKHQRESIIHELTGVFALHRQVSRRSLGVSEHAFGVLHYIQPCRVSLLYLCCLLLCTLCNQHACAFPAGRTGSSYEDPWPPGHSWFLPQTRVQIHRNPPCYVK